MKLTVVVCTHNRQALLDRLLASLSRAVKPEQASVEVLVVANACTDQTLTVVQKWSDLANSEPRYRVSFAEEPLKGKSHALNQAMRLLDGNAVAVVDDDQRVDHFFLTTVVDKLEEHPEISLFCGRLIPDWTGREPDWVHDRGRYAIYPPPITTYDLGGVGKRLEPGSWPPPGGDLVYRRALLDDLGEFSTELGPMGHDYGSGEDNEHLKRALDRGEVIWYAPEILQYHHVELSRLSLPSLIRMSFHRSRASVRVHSADTGIPRYLWRKLAVYLLSAVVSLSVRRTRFFLIRSAAALGEMSGLREANLRKPAD